MDRQAVASRINAAVADAQSGSSPMAKATAAAIATLFHALADTIDALEQRVSQLEAIAGPAPEQGDARGAK